MPKTTVFETFTSGYLTSITIAFQKLVIPGGVVMFNSSNRNLLMRNLEGNSSSGIDLNVRKSLDDAWLRRRRNGGIDGGAAVIPIFL
jgi:hypothetical protein